MPQFSNTPQTGSVKRFSISRRSVMLRYDPDKSFPAYFTAAGSCFADL
jgi:hypothetical protein